MERKKASEKGGFRELSIAHVFLFLHFRKRSVLSEGTETWRRSLLSSGVEIRVSLWRLSRGVWGERSVCFLEVLEKRGIAISTFGDPRV